MECEISSDLCGSLSCFTDSPKLQFPSEFDVTVAVKSLEERFLASTLDFTCN